MLFSTSTLAAKMLPGASGVKKAIDKHHIFPKQYLSEIGYSTDRETNQMANFTYLDYSTNIDISDTAPSEYVARYRNKLGEDGYRRTCAENALPANFETLAYPIFLEQRLKLMAGIVKKAYKNKTKEWISLIADKAVRKIPLLMKDELPWNFCMTTN